MAARFSYEDLERKYNGMTVVGISQRILNPIAAVKEALETYQFNQM